MYRRQVNFNVAMITLAITQITMRACIQIQNGDTPRRLPAAACYSAGRRTSSSVITRIRKSSPRVQCSM